ncbi:MAG: hypothetical protein ACK6CU_25935 [Deltaproteobacteria bacterium]
MVLPTGKTLGARAINNLLAKLAAATSEGEVTAALTSSAGHSRYALGTELLERGLLAPRTAAELVRLRISVLNCSAGTLTKLLDAIEEAPLDGALPQPLFEILLRAHTTVPEAMAPARRRAPLRGLTSFVLLSLGEPVTEPARAEAAEAVLPLLSSMNTWRDAFARRDEQYTETQLRLCALCLSLNDAASMRARPDFESMPSELRASVLAALPLEALKGTAVGMLSTAEWQQVFSGRTEPASAFFAIAESLSDWAKLPVLKAGLARSRGSSDVPAGVEDAFFAPGLWSVEPVLSVVGTERVDALARRLLTKEPPEGTPTLLLLAGLPLSREVALAILGAPQPYPSNPAAIDPYGYFARFRQILPSGAALLLPLLVERAAASAGDTAKGYRLALAQAVARAPESTSFVPEIDEHLNLGDVLNSDERVAVSNALARLGATRGENILVRDAALVTPAHSWLAFVPHDPSNATVRRVARTIADHLHDEMLWVWLRQLRLDPARLGPALVEAMEGRAVGERVLAQLVSMVPASAEALRLATGKPLDLAEVLSRLKAPGPTVTIYLLAVDRSAAATGLARAGGSPHGITPERIPRHRGRKLVHAFTLDLAEVPELAARFSGARTLSIYVQGYSEDSPRAQALIAQTEAELATAPGTDGVALKLTRVSIPAAVFDAAPSTELSHACSLLLRSPGFVLGGPAWLQSGRSGIDASFIAQFDERLAPVVNLGDAGVCYCFADRAEWQCL